MSSQTKIKLLIAAKATSISQCGGKKIYLQLTLRLLPEIEIIENLISQNFDEK